MKLRNTDSEYGSIAKSLHWLVALLVIGLLAAGFVMTSMPLSPDRLKLYGLHKSFGITVLALVVVRLAWRMANPVPALPSHMEKAEKFAAHGAHYALYALLLLMPMTGWLMSSAAGFPVSVFGLFRMPDLIGANKEAREILGEVHEIGAWILIVLVSLHVLAALFHHFHHKDDVLRRMLPIVLFCLFFVTPAEAAEVPAFALVPEKSRLGFTAMVNNAPSEGEFKSFTTEIHFDPDNLEGSRVKVQVDMLSLSSTYEEIMANLKTADWFNTEVFPQAILETTAFRHLGGQNYEADATLTIRDRTKPVTLAFALEQYDAGSAIVSGSTVIKRSEFGVGQGEWQDTGTVADEVTVTFHVEAVGKG